MSGIKDLHGGRKPLGGGRGPGRPVVVLETGTPEDVEALVKQAQSTLDEAVHLNNVAIAKIDKLQRGADGKSAYELYLEKGGELSLDEWLASLHGQDGQDADIAAAEAATTAANEGAAAANAATDAAIAAEATRQQTFETNEASRQTAAQNAEANRNGAYENAEDDRDEAFATSESQRSTTFTQNESGRSASVTAAQAAATAAATSAESANQKFTAIQEAISELDPSQSTSDAVAAEAVTRAAADAQMAADIAALGPKIDEVAGGSYDLSDQFTFTANMAVASLTGNIIGSSGNKLSANQNYVSIEGYDTLTLTCPKFNVETSIGLCFYSSNDSSSRISGRMCSYDASLADYSYETITIEIPNGAKYIRTTWLHQDYGATFSCVAKKIGRIDNMVEKSDIVNDLSGGTDKVLSAERGKVMGETLSMLDKEIINKHWENTATGSKKLFDCNIPANTKFGLKVSLTSSDTPTRIIVYVNSNVDTAYRLFDSTASTSVYGEWLVKEKDFDISSIGVRYYPDDGVGIKVEAKIDRTLLVASDEIKDNAITSSKLADGSVSSQKLINGSVTKDKLEQSCVADNQLDADNISFLAYQRGSNLFDKNAEDIVVGKWLNYAGHMANNADINVSGYIPVTEGKTYYFSTGTARSHEYYDSNKQVIASSYVGSLAAESTAPSGAKFLRVSYYVNYADTIKINEDSVKPYEAYYAPYIVVNGSKIKKNSIDGEIIKDNSISYAKLGEDTKSRIAGGSIGCFNEAGEVEPSGYMTLPATHIQKNNLLSCSIDGIVETIAVGVGYSSSDTYGYRGYAALWVEIDNTSIKQYRSYNGDPQLVSTNAHGLTLTNHTKVILDLAATSGKAMIFNDNGDYYETSLESAGVGTPFVYNGGTSNIECRLSAYPRELTKKVWLFGDSYISFVFQNRWPYYFAQSNHIDWLCNSQPGMSPSSGVTDLQNLLELGCIPRLLVWTLGMNGDTSESQVDGQYVINSYQKECIDSVVSICQQHNITLVIGIVPTVPTRQKTGFGIYVKSLGVRYIDFAAAVGTDSSGNWNEGLLSSDGVHPSVTGAKVLASQVYVDCPELAIIE